jgi:hypothetical protein
MCSEHCSIKDIQHYNVKSEAIRRQTFHNSPVHFIDKTTSQPTGFYSDWKDVVCCAFCEVQLSQWKQEDGPFKGHKRWSPTCGYIKGIFPGNIPVGSINRQSTRSRDVCGSWKVSTIASIYCFLMCAFFISLFTNFLCALYSWTAKSIQTQDK